MELIPQASLIHHFSKVDDPRVAYLVEHKLIDILIMAVCAVIGGAWIEVELPTGGASNRALCSWAAWLVWALQIKGNKATKEDD